MFLNSLSLLIICIIFLMLRTKVVFNFLLQIRSERAYIEQKCFVCSSRIQDNQYTLKNMPTTIQNANTLESTWTTTNI
jgi:hypothetical protein